jgi:hypothetical protein
MHKGGVDNALSAEVDPDAQLPARGIAGRKGDRSLPPSWWPSRAANWVAPGLIVLFCTAHDAAIWFVMGGLAALKNGWPFW